MLTSRRSLGVTTLATNCRHRPIGLQETRVVDAVTWLLAGNGSDPEGSNLGVAGAASQRRTQIGLGAGEQAIPNLAVGCQPDPVAGAAEGLRDGRDDAN